MIYHFNIALEESDPLVWRKIVVPADYSFYKLHMAIQGAFGWENRHLFQFSENGFKSKLCYGIPDDDETDPELVILDARKTRINKVFNKRGQSLVYIYDFGDNWEHRITFEKKEMKDMDPPYCLKGAGACPPEDVGGIGGYNSMLEVFHSDNHSEKMQYREWLGLVEGETWNAAFCSIREINKRLCLLE
jgi:hypothetical protein